MSKKKLIVAAASLAMVATLAIGGTLAYFSDDESATNVITMGKVDITLTETSDDQKVNDEDLTDGITYEDVMPGDKIDKNAFVALADKSRDAYVAVKYEIVFDDETPDVLPVINFVEGWEESKTVKGLFIYTGVLSLSDAEGAISKIQSLDYVKVPTSWTEAYDFTIVVTAYAVQAENTADTYVSLLEELATK